MPDKKRFLRHLPPLLALSAALGSGLHAEPQQALAPDARVRVQSDWIEGGGWREGRIADATRCLMIRLDKPTDAGYNRIALLALNRLQQRTDSGKWDEVDVGALLAREPTGCRDERGG